MVLSCRVSNWIKKFSRLQTFPLLVDFRKSTIFIIGQISVAYFFVQFIFSIRLTVGNENGRWLDSNLGFMVSKLWRDSKSPPSVKFVFFFCSNKVLPKNLFEIKHCASSEQIEAQLQCDQMARLFFNIWPFITMKLCSWTLNFTKVSSTFCQKPHKPSKICLRLLTLGQSWEISQNLVTLNPTQNWFNLFHWN